MAATWVAAGQTAFNGSTPQSTPSVTWQAGDEVWASGICEDASGNISTPTATGLTFSLVQDFNPASNCRVKLFKATPGSGSSSAVAFAWTGVGHGCGFVNISRGTAGNSTPVTVSGSASLTFSLTRAAAGSLVVCCVADWNGVADFTVTAVPSTAGTVDGAGGSAGIYGGYGFHWDDQGSTGTTSYGMAAFTGTPKFTGHVTEILAAGGGGAAYLPPTVIVPTVAVQRATNW